MPLVVVPIGAVVAAVFALLFMLAWAQWGNTITNSLNIDIPIIGNVIGHAVADLLEATYAILVYWFDHLIDPIVNVIIGPIAVLENSLGALKAGMSYVTVAFDNLSLRVLPIQVFDQISFAMNALADVEADVDGYAYSLFQTAMADTTSVIESVTQVGAQLENYVDTAINHIQAEIDALPSAVLPDLTSLTNRLEADIANNYSGVESDIANAYSAATSYANNLATTLEGDIAAGINAAETYAQSVAVAIPQIITTDIANAINGALAGIYTDIDAAITDVIGVAGTDDADVIDALRRIPLSVPLDLTGLAALVGAGSLTMLRFLRDCGIPNCRDLSGFGNDLQNLLTLVDDTAFLGLLVELIHHPNEGPEVVESLFSSSIDSTVSTFRALVGI